MNSPVTPETLLPEGVDVAVCINPYTQESGPARKGTIAATLNNVAKLNPLLASPLNEDTKSQIQALMAEIDRLIPSLKIVGMFDFFEPKEWIGKGNQLGRVAVILLFLKHYPDQLSFSIQQQLFSIKEATDCKYLNSYFADLGIVRK